MSAREQVEARLRAYIHPNAVETGAQQEAFDEAVDAQLEYEAGGENLPGNVKSFSVGSYSVTLGGGAGESLGPAARAVLFNAGLLKRSWPTARRM